MKMNLNILTSMVVLNFITLQAIHGADEEVTKLGEDFTKR
jgi:hypothetical protein